MIFISYSWIYKDKVNHFIQTLRDLNKEFWIDDERLDLKLSIEKQIEVAINKCDEFIQLTSSDSPNTFWMNFEYQIALNTLTKDQIKIVNIDCACKNIAEVESSTSALIIPETNTSH